MPSTCAEPEKHIGWFFFNPVNTKSWVYSLDVTGYSSKLPIERLDWVAVLWDKFEFRADKSTLEFWQVISIPHFFLSPDI